MNSFADILLEFKPLFSCPGFNVFCKLAVAWIATHGRKTITRLTKCVVGKDIPAGHHAKFHRFFTQTKWCPNALGKVLLKLLGPFLHDEEVLLLIDDSLFRKTGPRIIGAGMHHDPLRTTKSGRRGSNDVASFGIDFVVLCVWVPCSFVHGGGIAVPFMFRLYRPKKTCPANRYRSKTLLANEMIAEALPLLKGKVIRIAADSEFACKTVLSELDFGVAFLGPLPMNAQLHDPIVVNKKGRGRKRVWGNRISAPNKFAADRSFSWKKFKCTLYGKQVAILVKTFEAVWRSSGPGRVLRVVVTRDPKGRWRDRAYFCTDNRLTPTEILETFARRWSIEVMFRDSKQCLGLESIQNGWTKRRKKPRRKAAGPHADNRRRPLATERTTPFGWLVYGIIVVRYLRCGNPADDVSLVRKVSPWFGHKLQISFGDMWRSAVREILSAEFRGTRMGSSFSEINLDCFVDWAFAA